MCLICVFFIVIFTFFIHLPTCPRQIFTDPLTHPGKTQTFIVKRSHCEYSGNMFLQWLGDYGSDGIIQMHGEQKQDKMTSKPSFGVNERSKCSIPLTDTYNWTLRTTEISSMPRPTASPMSSPSRMAATQVVTQTILARKNETGNLIINIQYYAKCTYVMTVFQACVFILSLTFTSMKILYVCVTLSYIYDQIEPKLIVNVCFKRCKP